MEVQKRFPLFHFSKYALFIMERNPNFQVLTSTMPKIMDTYPRLMPKKIENFASNSFKWMFR